MVHKIFSVEELANTGNTTSRAIRLYGEKGLLEPMYVGRTMGFAEDVVQILERIQRAKRLGFSLDEIRTCQTGHNAQYMLDAIKRIEALMGDAEIEIADLHTRLAATTQRRRNHE